MLWSKVTALLAATIAFFSATVPSVTASPIDSENKAFANYPDFINKRDVNDGIVARGNDRRSRGSKISRGANRTSRGG
ncbi:9456_t:CDS:2, partial [Funneliformis geosporum]